jgi:hypothetical protein
VPTFDLYEELRAIVDAFEARGVDHALCGAVALAIHGKPRATTDIDILVAPAEIDEAKTVLRALGYDLEAAPMTFASGIRVHRVSRVEGRELFTVDLLVAEPPLADAWRDRLVLSWRDKPLRVVSRDGLAAMKRLAGRPQDRADLHALGADDDE